ncbi:sulfurtransferase [Corynebacterium epidermidicanis]|uniref:Rhodanese-related sulfurtransferase n=1 Tax=Corynebacterium epidermidicanis TaxID=1050174 RepID=A0A0G3GLX2_9CORY|nr:sulfurtransferase [Corynebacterium epidermidicanis]AKK02196.1 rhodanese-related sulfurtransferase [Corynebacterium epidermidicanis]
MGITITPRELLDRVRTSKKTTIINSVWEPGEGASYLRFRDGHIPDSMFCDAAAALAGVPSSQQGRNPLPDHEQVARLFRTVGMNVDSQVVVYDNDKGLMAARAWWILTWAGVPNVRILDGGLQAWQREGLPIVGGPGNLSTAANMNPQLGQLPTATIEEVKAHVDNGGVLVDCREHNRFAGRKEALDLKAGHIPGAINLPSLDLFDENYQFRSRDEIREMFAQHNITSGESVIVYSGSGLHSAQMIAAMHHAGLEGAALFVGGWSLWAADRSNPVMRVD